MQNAGKYPFIIHINLQNLQISLCMQRIRSQQVLPLEDL